jgi:hypothetical protein
LSPANQVAFFSVRRANKFAWWKTGFSVGYDKLNEWLDNVMNFLPSMLPLQKQFKTVKLS